MVGGAIAGEKTRSPPPPPMNAPKIKGYRIKAVIFTGKSQSRLIKAIILHYNNISYKGVSIIYAGNNIK